MAKIIWGNTVVKNEGRYIWFAIKSVIDHLDKILIYDTGSIDDTVKIIDLLKKDHPNKIIFKKMGEVNAEGLTRLRQKMLDETTSDWLILVDGDEVWWRNSIKKTVNRIQTKGDILYALVNPVINLVGDIYHYRTEETGRYKILGKKGHFNIRAINRKIKGLHIKNEYPLEGFFTEEKKLIQDYGQEKLEFINGPLLHFSHLIRSNLKEGDKDSVKRSIKIKYEIGVKFPSDFEYPEVFYQPYPSFINSPWQHMSMGFRLRALAETPLKKIKREITDEKSKS
ncbi:glycosyltransferase [Candidatus Daviesbacteria bacterium]|nr:glycosyltransferase [Candidatus Daviesbacteria bacterium]